MARETMHGYKRSVARTALGSVALVAALVLSWPGVQVARAEANSTDQFGRFMTFIGEPASHAAVPRPADSCDATRAVQNAEAQAARTLEQMKRRVQQARAEGHAAGPRGADEQPPAVMMLNSRGYNYGAGAAPAAEIGRLHQELAQRRAQRH